MSQHLRFASAVPLLLLAVGSLVLATPGRAATPSKPNILFVLTDDQGYGDLSAHLDVFPTLAELAGATLPAAVQRQIDGRSLVPLLRDPGAPWADRQLFTHQGRWPRFADPNESKFAMAAVRNTRWALVSEKGGRELAWQLFDLAVDYAQQHDVAARHPDMVRELGAAFDRWWADCLPLMVNEKVLGQKLNPFAVWYWEQFGGGPTAADYEKMDPTRSWPAPAPAAGKGKAARKTAH